MKSDGLSEFEFKPKKIIIAIVEPVYKLPKAKSCVCVKIEILIFQFLTRNHTKTKVIFKSQNLNIYLLIFLMKFKIF